MATEDSTPRRARKRSGAVTLHDVAKLAGVAPITASRVVNTPDKVSVEVRERVQDAIRRVGYVPNRVAGGLASARSRLIAALVPTVGGLVFIRTMRTLSGLLADHGYQLMIGETGYVDSREDALIDAIIGRRPDGIVLTGTVHSPEARRRLLGSGIPIVEIWDLTPTPIDMLVGFSHERVGHDVADFLHGRGRRCLGALVGDDERSRRRLRAFQARLAALGAAPADVEDVHAPTTAGSGREAFVRLLARRPDVDAVFCTADMMAMGVLAEAHGRGIAMPGQLAVVGFGDFEFAAHVHPSLTTVRIDGDEIGRQAAKLLLDRLEERPIEQTVVDVGHEIIVRHSA